MFLDHEFTDRIRFFSELEIEHSVASNDSDERGESNRPGCNST